ncbi:MAG: hypothetical protein K2X73_09000 [Sphingomonas sp.]|uniref:hypothetical protein n=1 Tax=Sphingomonas sp. TaxID=28214 RepID=UPI000A0BBBBA|nr:hypothetical protein [Sphingomonas sp.]MBX9882097.1 hypothetical protein [Sphingomonas sp.]OQW47666.1 MAG: hypothetical protein A4S16_08010 [Proteobacteria bacterium SG_bin6]
MINPVLIPILGICCGLMAIFGGVVVRPWLRFQQRKLEVEAQLARERASIDSARQERLEARVAVLERIVTDRGMGLADEIERLRDKPLN